MELHQLHFINFINYMELYWIGPPEHRIRMEHFLQKRQIFLYYFGIKL